MIDDSSSRFRPGQRVRLRVARPAGPHYPAAYRRGLPVGTEVTLLARHGNPGSWWWTTTDPDHGNIWESALEEIPQPAPADGSTGKFRVGQRVRARAFANRPRSTEDGGPVQSDLPEGRVVTLARFYHAAPGIRSDLGAGLWETSPASRPIWEACLEEIPVRKLSSSRVEVYHSARDSTPVTVWATESGVRLSTPPMHRAAVLDRKQAEKLHAQLGEALGVPETPDTARETGGLAEAMRAYSMSVNEIRHAEESPLARAAAGLTPGGVAGWLAAGSVTERAVRAALDRQYEAALQDARQHGSSWSPAAAVRRNVSTEKELRTLAGLYAGGQADTGGVHRDAYGDFWHQRTDGGYALPGGGAGDARSLREVLQQFGTWEAPPVLLPVGTRVVVDRAVPSRLNGQVGRITQHETRVISGVTHRYIVRLSSGVCVRVAELHAEPAEPWEPMRVRDRDGDVWERTGADEYKMWSAPAGRHLTGCRSLASLRAAYGPLVEL